MIHLSRGRPCGMFLGKILDLWHEFGGAFIGRDLLVTPDFSVPGHASSM
jgi:hypothetical protein